MREGVHLEEVAGGRGLQELLSIVLQVFVFEQPCDHGRTALDDGDVQDILSEVDLSVECEHR